MILLDQIGQGDDLMEDSNHLFEPLTQREKEILQLLAQGLSDPEIAQQLVLAPGTVKWYNKQLYRKLDVHSRSEAVSRARELGLLENAVTELPSGTLSFLFTDIESSTRLWEQHPEPMRRALERHDALLRRAIEANDGRVFKTMGDAFCAVFDDAAKALSAAHAAQMAILGQDWGETPIRIRIALHSGVAERRSDDYFGPPVNHVARLLSTGHGGQILVSAATRALAQSRFPDALSFRDLGEHRLKDLDRPERIYQLIAPDLPADFSPINSLLSELSNLPAQRTSFVGRESEIAEVKRMLELTRLLTLTGPPGTGKTRMALRVAAEVLNQYQDGAYLVELAPITDSGLVTSTIAQVFGIRETAGQPLLATLQTYLREKQLLLLLDNFEQVIDAAPLVGELLSASPGLKVLVTSRETLRVYGEQEYNVPPLMLPNPEDDQSLRELSHYESVDLFVQRARAARSDFALTEENSRAVAALCVQLDGLPLAIELAAARCKVLAPETMLRHLESRLMTLTGGARDLPARLKTLRGAIDWSYDLLNPAEKALFAWLSVFQGGRSVEAVDAVCGHDPAIDVLEGLESLLNKSLLGLDAKLDGEPRFVMLEMIHEYARERLEEGGEARDIQRRHAEYFLALTEHAEAEFNVVRQEYWNTRLTDELDNIRTAFNWALDSGAVEFGARLVAALRDFWVWNGFLSESSAWIDRALESEERISPVVRAKTLNTSSRLAFICGEHTRGETLARQALSLAQESDDKVNCAWALLYLSSHLSAFDEKIEEAITRAEESLTLFRELDHKAGTAHSLNMLGELARLDGDYGRAGKLYEECLTLSCETGNKEREALSLGNLSYVAYHLGNFDEAIDYSKKALALSNSLQMAYASTLCIATIAGPICAKGNPRRAARLLSASEGQFEAMGASIQPGDKLEVDQFKNAIREQLGEIEFNKVWAEGQTMSLEEAVTSALGNDIE